MAARNLEVIQPKAGDRRFAALDKEIALRKLMEAEPHMHAKNRRSGGTTVANRRMNVTSAARRGFARSLTIVLGGIIGSSWMQAEPVAVRFVEGLSRGFVILETLDGRRLADGESIQTVRADRVTSHLTLQFLDGSFYEDRAVFSQRRTFKILSDHTVQRGPAFKQAMDVVINGATGEVTVHYAEDGKNKTASEHLDLPDDTANGFLLTALKNLPPGLESTSLSYIAAGPKPRLIKLEIRRTANEPFWSGSLRRDAVHYVLKVNLRGFAGAVAPLVGKQPPDSQVWVAAGAAPAIVQTEAPLGGDGPVWRLVPSGTRPSFQNPATKSARAGSSR